MGYHDDPTLDDVMEPTEPTAPHHRQHAKAPKHLDDDDLSRRAEREFAEAEREESDRR